MGSFSKDTVSQIISARLAATLVCGRTVYTLRRRIPSPSISHVFPATIPRYRLLIPAASFRKNVNTPTSSQPRDFLFPSFPPLPPWSPSPSRTRLRPAARDIRIPRRPFNRRFSISFYSPDLSVITRVYTYSWWPFSFDFSDNTSDTDKKHPHVHF